MDRNIPPTLSITPAPSNYSLPSLANTINSGGITAKYPPAMFIKRISMACFLLRDLLLDLLRFLPRCVSRHRECDREYMRLARDQPNVKSYADGPVY